MVAERVEIVMINTERWKEKTGHSKCTRVSIDHRPGASTAWIHIVFLVEPNAGDGLVQHSIVGASTQACSFAVPSRLLLLLQCSEAWSDC